MEANELRIGNKVKFSEDGSYFTVVDITKGGLGVENDAELTWIEIDQFEGIPLTEEILVKAGFERLNNGLSKPIPNGKFHREIPIDDFCIWNPIGTKQFSLNGELFTPKIKYVHQLQNLYYSLTGEELKIDL